MSERKDKEIAIKVDGVYKDFNLPHEINNSLKQKLLHPLKRSKMEKQHALKNISFEINKGDFFGIVGRNGSGKSTLLKIIAQIYTPTKGSVTVNGSLTPFIELGVGFNPELTGRENVFLNGAMLGFSKKEMAEMYDEIVEFAELEKFMDQKLKNYSSGMQVRLAFSVAIRAKSDILLLDEVLAVGDINFQKKCFNYFRELKKEKKTVVFVTHSMSQVKEYCNKAILIDNSKRVDAEGIEETLDKYVELMNLQGRPQDNTTQSSNLKLIDHKVSIDDKYIELTVKIKNINIKDRIYPSMLIKNNIGEGLFGYNGAINTDGKELDPTLKDITLHIRFLNNFTNGKYYVNLGIVDKNGDAIVRKEDAVRFSITKGGAGVHSLNPAINISQIK